MYRAEGILNCQTHYTTKSLTRSTLAVRIRIRIRTAPLTSNILTPRRLSSYDEDPVMRISNVPTLDKLTVSNSDIVHPGKRSMNIPSIEGEVGSQNSSF